MTKLHDGVNLLRNVNTKVSGGCMGGDSVKCIVKSAPCVNKRDGQVMRIALDRRRVRN